MVTPEVVVIERFQPFPYRQDAGTRGVQRNGSNLNSGHVCCLQGLLHGFDQRPHVIRVTLRGVVRIILCAVKRIFRDRRAQASSFAVDNGDTDAEGAKIYACDNSHWALYELASSNTPAIVSSPARCLLRMPVGFPAKISNGGL